MIGFVASLIGSKTGRMFLTVAVTLATVAVIVLRAFQKGREHEQLRSTQKRLENLQNAIATDRAVRDLPADQRRARLERWLRDDDTE